MIVKRKCKYCRKIADEVRTIQHAHAAAVARIAELEAGEDLTAAYMIGFEKGKHAIHIEIGDKMQHAILIDKLPDSCSKCGQSYFDYDIMHCFWNKELNLYCPNPKPPFSSDEPDVVMDRYNERHPDCPIVRIIFERVLGL